VRLVAFSYQPKPQQILLKRKGIESKKERKKLKKETTKREAAELLLLLPYNATSVPNYRGAQCVSSRARTAIKSTPAFSLLFSFF